MPELKDLKLRGAAHSRVRSAVRNEDFINTAKIKTAQQAPVKSRKNSESVPKNSNKRQNICENKIETAVYKSGCRMYFQTGKQI